MLGPSHVLSLFALASTAFSAPSGSIEKRAPTVYLAGDSTMAKANGAAGTLQGEPLYHDNDLLLMSNIW
jgi:rhamnogalacturonan acetylesterase